jgi:hypothetical protein
MKVGKEHRVPLTERAVAILDKAATLRKTDDSTEFLSPCGRQGRRLSSLAFEQLFVSIVETGLMPLGFRTKLRRGSPVQLLA